MTINKNIPIADSNILISYFTKDNNYKKAKEAIKEKGCYYNEFILCETVNYIQNKYSHFHSMDAHRIIVQDSFSFSFLPALECLYKPAMDLREKYADNCFALTDCIVLVQAESLGLTVHTSDIKMQNYRAVNVINPLI
ncbi:MAG: PIN domain-containing protein [Deltaproteobacteria bacterium]|nr:PIN domain-containing protein [Deltaproteobacteria bacterium]